MMMMMSANKNSGSSSSSKRLIYLMAFVAVCLMLVADDFAPNGGLLVAGEKKTDILFLKGKFILKDKKGSIVISDDKKDCHCPHYYHR